MLYIEGVSVTELFTRAVTAVISEGRAVSPRGTPTLEVMPAHLRLAAPRDRLLDASCGRRINPAFAAAEAVWVLAGSDAPWIFGFNARLREFTDGGVLRGAYGPRLRAWRAQPAAVDQMGQARRLLIDDPETRRATVCLFDPSRDFADVRDVPCTVTWRFFIRDGLLEMHTTMRSQDLWLGLPYDVFTATVLQELMAGWCGVEVGAYHHEVSSLHLYRRDLAAAAEVRSPTGTPASDPARLAVSWGRLPSLVEGLLAGAPVIEPGWEGISGVLRSYLLWRAGHRQDARELALATSGELARMLDRWYDHLSAERPRAVAS